MASESQSKWSKDVARTRDSTPASLGFAARLRSHRAYPWLFWLTMFLCAGALGRQTPLAPAVIYVWAFLFGAALGVRAALPLLALAMVFELAPWPWVPAVWNLAQRVGHGLGVLVAFGSGVYFRFEGTHARQPARDPKSALLRASDGSTVMELQRPFVQFSLMLEALRAGLGLRSCALYLREGNENLRFVEGNAPDGFGLTQTLSLGRGVLGAVVHGARLVQHPIARGLMPPHLEHGAASRRSRAAEFRRRESGRRDASRAIPGDWGGVGAGAEAHFAGVPVMDGAELKGVLCADRLVDQPFSEAELAALAATAKAAVVAAKSEGLLARLYRSKREQGILYDSSRCFASALDESSVVTVALDAARSVTHFDFAAITRFESEGEKHRVVYAEGEEAATWQGREFGGSGSLAAMSLEERCVLPLRGRYEPEQQVLFDGLGNLQKMRFLWVFPLISQDKPVGTLVLARRFAWDNAESTRATIELLGGQLAMAISNADLVQRLEAMATTDALTGCKNKRSFRAELQTRLQSALRFDRPLALIVADLDFFKKVNDTYGHGVGDQVLREFGALLGRVKRQTDVVARFGGEEFCLLCEETEAEGALFLAERIREELEGTTLVAAVGSRKGEEIRVTCSVGVACFPAHAQSESELFELADQALYRAKGAGRNCVLLASAGSAVQQQSA